MAEPAKDKDKGGISGLMAQASGAATTAAGTAKSAKEPVRGMSYDDGVDYLKPGGGLENKNALAGQADPPGYLWSHGTTRAPAGRPGPKVEVKPLEIPPYHVILEQLAHRFAYKSPDFFDPLPPASGKAPADDKKASPTPTKPPQDRSLPEPMKRDAFKDNPVRRDMALLDNDDQARRAALAADREAIIEEQEILKSVGYAKEKIVASSATGFQAILFVPYAMTTQGKKDPNKIKLPAGVDLRPVVAFRGTDNLKGALDDANPQGIGAFQWSSHAREVKDMLSHAIAFGGPADVTGHSLGGALAQRCANAYGSLIRDIVTFQSPGIGDGALNVDPKKHKSTHYVMSGDVVSETGGRRTPGDVVTMSAGASDGLANHTKYPLATHNERQKDGKKVAGVPGDPSLGVNLMGLGGYAPTELADTTESRKTWEHRRLNPGKTIWSDTRGLANDAGGSGAGAAVTWASTIFPRTAMTLRMGLSVGVGVGLPMAMDGQAKMIATMKGLETYVLTATARGISRAEFDLEIWRILKTDLAGYPDLIQHARQEALSYFDAKAKPKPIDPSNMLIRSNSTGGKTPHSTYVPEPSPIIGPRKN